MRGFSAPRFGLLCLTLVWGSLSASAAWTDGTSNPVFAPAGAAYYPYVLYDGASFSGHGAAYPYKMWYTSRSPWGIGLAGSDDGLSWTVLTSAGTGLANPHHVAVVYDPGGFGGTGAFYRIWYWAQSENLYSLNAIHTARSVDGIAWTDDQPLTQVGSTVVTGVWPNWNTGSYGPIAVIFNPTGSATLDDVNIFRNRFVMYYDGTTGGQEAWGLAYSTDGLQWKGYNGGVAPVLPVGAAGAWDDAYAAHGSVVRNPDCTWDLWYGGGHTTSSQGIGHATSPDGIVWTKDLANPLVDLGCPAPASPLGCAGTWNASRNYTPVVLAWPSPLAVQDLKMWRTGKSAASGDASYTIGYASMPSTRTVRNVPADYATIQAAMDAANAGDTVLIAAGVYDESVAISKPLTLEGVGLPTVQVPLGGGQYGVTIAQGTSCVTIRGIRFLGNSSTAIQEGGILIEAKTAVVGHITVDSCVFYGLDNGFESRGHLSDLHLLSNIFEAIQDWSAIEVTTINMGAGLPYAVDGVEIRGNTIRNSFTIPIKLSNYSYLSASTMTNLTVADNQIYGNDGDGNENWMGGITLRHGANFVTLTGNTIRDNTDLSGINIAGPGTYDHLVIRGNALYRNTGVDRWPANPLELSAGIKFRSITGPATYSITFNALYGNAGAGLDWNGAFPLVAANNWWGCNYGPGAAGTGCPTAPNGVAGTVTALGWLTLTGAADPTSVPANGGTSAITAALANAPDGIPVQFSGTLGSCVPLTGALLSGSASSIFTAGPAQGLGGASITVDGQTLTFGINVENPIPTLTSHSPAWARADAVVPFTLTLDGAFFMSTSSVRWDGTPLATTYVNDTRLTVQITATERTVGTHGVTVFNPAPGGGTSASLPFEVRPIPATVWVDLTWAGTPPDSDPDGAGPATHFGYDAFAVIQQGVDAVATGGTVVVHAGSYLAEVTVNRAMILQGAGIDLTVLMGRKDAGGSGTLTIGGGVTVEGFTITRDGNNPADWGTNLKSSGVVFAQGTTGSTLRSCKVTGNRNGVYINNAQGHTIRDCIISFNRTGFQFANDVTGTTVVHNGITDNWTMGVLFINNATPTASVTLRDNLISGNWYGEIQCRTTGGAALLDVSRNSFGGTPLVRTNIDSAEPGYALQIPVAYGGTAVPPGNAPTIGGVRASRLDYTPWLHSASDSDPGPRFQGDYSDLHVSAESAQIEALGRINEALGILPGGGGTVHIEAGSYDELVNLQGRPALSLLGAGRDTVILKPSATTSWAIPGYPQYDGRRAAVRAYACADLVVSGLTLDMEVVRGSNIIGLFAWDTPLAVDACAFRNNSLPDNQSVAEITSYVRAAAFTPAARAPVSFTNSRFTDTGRVGIVLHDWLNATVDHNTFHKDVHDFGYAVEMGSTATGSITYNTVDGYDTPASDGSASAGLYIENAFTNAIADPTPKPVAVGHNEISACQYGMWIGNEYPDYAGNVDIAVTMDHNNIHDNLEGGVFVADEGRDHGSSVTVTGADDVVRDNGTFGYFFTTYYNGEIHADLQRQTLTGQNYGLRAEDYNPNAPNPAPPYNSLYDVSLTLSDLAGDAAFGMQNATAGGAVFTGTCNWWGTPTGPTHPTNVGGTGSAASDGVTFSPWAGTDTFDCVLRYAIPTELAFVQQPTTTRALATMAPAVTVRAQDASGNLGYNFAGAVSLALGGGTPGATLGGEGTGATHGLATFAALSVDLDGTGYTLTASSAGLTDDTSDLFDILRCLDPAFLSAIAAPDSANLDSRQTLTLTNPAGSAVPNSFAFTWDAAFTVRSFSADPDGILGFWQEMKPYAFPFTPSVSHEVIRTGASTAFVDVDDNGSYDPGTDYDVTESGNAITVSRTVAPGSVEDAQAGYRLILQDSLFTNPADEGTYYVQALLGSHCAAAWGDSTGEITGPPGAGCPPGSLTRDVGDTLRVTQSGNRMTLSWDPVAAEPCMTGYAVFASHDCTQWPPYTPITGQDLDMDFTNTSLTAGLDLSVEFYLVTEAGDGGQTGPLGHYGM